MLGKKLQPGGETICFETGCLFSGRSSLTRSYCLLTLEFFSVSFFTEWITLACQQSAFLILRNISFSHILLYSFLILNMPDCSQHARFLKRIVFTHGLYCFIFYSVFLESGFCAHYLLESCSLRGILKSPCYQIQCLVFLFLFFWCLNVFGYI